jgi:phage gp29-like protein
MPIIYDQFGRPFQKKKMPEQRTLAAAPIMDTWREYVTSGLTPERLAAIFREADAGDMRRQAELFDQVEEKDGHLVGEKGKRVNVILDVEFKTSPVSDDSQDVKVAEFVQEYFDNLTDFEDILVSLQDAVGKGYSCLEIDWDVSEGQALPGKFEYIEQKRFLFTDATGILLRNPLLLTDDDPMGIDIPAWKTLFHRYGGKSGHPTKSGIYRVCAWMYLFKNYSIKDWVIFCEIFGMPLRLGKYDAGASEEDKDALYTAIASLGTDAAGIISQSTDIQFLDKPTGTPSAGLWEALANFCNKEISKAILGQTLTADVGDAGSYAASKTHNEVRLDLLQADSRAVAATVRSQLIRPIVGFNFGWDTPVPKYQPIWDEEEDLGKKAEWMGNLLDRGVEMPVSFVRGEFNIPEPEKGEAVIGTQAAPVAAKHDTVIAKKQRVAAPGARFSPQQENIEVLTQEALKKATGALSGLLEPVKQMVAKANSLEEVRDGIIDVYGDMNPAELEELLARAMFMAELYGRFTVAA